MIAFTVTTSETTGAQRAPCGQIISLRMGTVTALSLDSALTCTQSCHMVDTHLSALPPPHAPPLPGPQSCFANRLLWEAASHFIIASCSFPVCERKQLDQTSPKFCAWCWEEKDSGCPYPAGRRPGDWGGGSGQGTVQFSSPRASLGSHEEELRGEGEKLGRTGHLK